MPEGNFRPIKDYENRYLISDTGLIWSIKKEKFLKPKKTKYGYLEATLYKDGFTEMKMVHRLVAQAFIPNPNNLPQVNHKDEDKTNNNVNNLEWCTASYNINYGTHKERMTKTLGTPIQCIETGIIYDGFADAEHKTNIAKSNIHRVCNGERKTAGGYHWKYVSKTD